MVQMHEMYANVQRNAKNFGKQMSPLSGWRVGKLLQKTVMGRTY